MIYLVFGVIAVAVILMVLGFGKNRIFTNPETISDAQIERTIRLTQTIMKNSQVGTKAWSEASAKFSAAYNEQKRRQSVAKAQLNTIDKKANSLQKTSQQIKTVFRATKRKIEGLIRPGSITYENQYYIGYLVGVAREHARMEGQSLIMFNALAVEELSNIGCLNRSEINMDHLNVYLKSEAGVIGLRDGVIDGRKLTDNNSAPPYYVELDKWIASRGDISA